MSDVPDRFDDPDAPVTDEERAGAERLRAALDDPGRPSKTRISPARCRRHGRHETFGRRPRARLSSEGARTGATAGRRLVRVSFGPAPRWPSPPRLLLVSRSDAHGRPRPSGRRGGRSQPVDAGALPGAVPDDRRGDVPDRSDCDGARDRPARQRVRQVGRTMKHGGLALFGSTVARWRVAAGCRQGTTPAARARRRPPAVDDVAPRVPLGGPIASPRGGHEGRRGRHPGAIDALDRLVAMPAPHAVEVDEVLADARARLAELRLERGDLDGAERDVQAACSACRGRRTSAGTCSRSRASSRRRGRPPSPTREARGSGARADAGGRAARGGRPGPGAGHRPGAERWWPQ